MQSRKNSNTLPVALGIASLLTSLIALGFATGGASSALAAAKQVTSGQIKNNNVKSVDIKNGTITGKDVKDNSLTGADVAEGSLDKVPAAAAADTVGGKTLRQISQWVYVQADGTVASSSGGVLAATTGTGRYRVTFPTAVAGCALNATPTTSSAIGDGGALDAGQQGVAFSTTGPNDVQVKTFNGAGVAADDQFFLTLQC